MNYIFALFILAVFLSACTNPEADTEENKINSMPYAVSQSLSTSENTQVIIFLSAKDDENNDLTYEIIDLPSRGSLSGSPPTVTYSPDRDYSGTDSFSFKVNDGDLDSNIATIVVEISPVNTPPIATAFITSLNDTGITRGSNYPSGNNSSCIGETISQQDCSHGRDVTGTDDSDGYAGFSYTKLDIDGNELPASITTWACVKDNITGLVWEKKQGRNNTKADEGLHDADDTFNWYNSNTNTNAGNSGYDNDDDAVCFGYNVNDPSSYCNTEAYVSRVNAVGLCGLNSWRVPTRAELRNIVNLGQQSPFIDMTYFPNTKNASYWSSSPDANWEYSAWFISFSRGSASTLIRSADRHVRLVHSVE